MFVVGIVFIIVSVMYFIGKATILKNNSISAIKVCMILCPLIGMGFIISAIISSLKTSKLLHTLKAKSSIMEIYYDLNNEKTIKLKDDSIRLSDTYIFLKDEVEIINYNYIVALYTHVEKNNEGNIALAQVLIDTNDKKKFLYTQIKLIKKRFCALQKRLMLKMRQLVCVCQVIDITDAPYMSAYEIHPNICGVQRIADIITQKMRELLIVI